MEHGAHRFGFLLEEVFGVPGFAGTRARAPVMSEKGRGSR